jgi:nucleotide-binding universal stress UspA family protein
MMIGDARQEAIDDHVAQERARARSEVISSLKLHELHDESRPLLVEEGVAREVLFRAVREIRPDLLVMETRGRFKLLTTLLGSVAEECLRSLDVDVLALPPPW